MMTTELYRGQGLGNQLWLYAVCRAIATHTNQTFGIQSFHRFKGRRFMDIGPGEEVIGRKHKGPSEELPKGVDSYFRDRLVLHRDGTTNVTPFYKEVFELRGSVKIDGYFQSEKYISSLKHEIGEWFQSTLALDVPDDICVISFRGGEYRNLPKVLLPKSFYHRAMDYIRAVEPRVRFVVVTDDTYLARSYFPDLPIISNRKVPFMKWLVLHPQSKNIGADFTWLQRAKFLILSNSSFSWWGAWTNLRNPVVVAPKYWANHNANDGHWSLGDSYTSGWVWLSASGEFSTDER